MERDFFDFIVKDLPKDGVKRACYVVREYRRCEKSGNLDMCAVSKEEFDSALAILLAYSYQTSDKDTLVEQWQCDSDCNRNNGLGDFCPGEFQISKDPCKKLCKHFSDSFNI